MPANQFQIVAHNPNAEQGGGDLCYPHKQVDDVRGPWVVFPNVDVAEAQGTLPLPHASLPISILKDILVEAAGVEAVDTDGTPDIHDQIMAPAKVTVPWEDVPVEARAGLSAAFPQGGITQFSGGVTDVPPADEAAAAPAPAEPDDLALLIESEGELPSEVPGPAPGTFVEVDKEDDEVPTI